MAILKRLLVGRPLATVEQEHQRIPKTIGLAVFSSDAISSTAYATEEILFVTAVGASSLALGLDTLVPIGIAVAILLAIVCSSYRQTIFAYPSGGGSYIVSRENLGETPSLIAGASLLVDYILTVAVSISAGVAAIISIPAFQRPRDASRRARSRAHRVHRPREPARHQGVGPVVRGARPTSTSSCSARWSRSASSAATSATSAPVPFDPAGVRRHRRGRRDARAVPDPEGVLVGRGRADRRRGDLATACRRSAGPSRRTPRTTLVCDGDDPRHAASSASSLLAHHLHPYPSHDETVISQLGLAVFGDGARLLRPAVRDGGDPDARREHRLRGLPPALVDHRPGRLPAPAARQPRRPAGVLERHPRALGDGRAPDHRVRRHHERAHPSLCGRRVHVVHAVAGGHGDPPPPAARTALEAQHGDQRASARWQPASSP